MIPNPPSFRGLNITMPIIIPIKGKGLVIRGLHYKFGFPGFGNEILFGHLL